jgi:hypothetical protein
MPHACADIPLWRSPHINTRFEPLFRAHENNFSKRAGGTVFGKAGDGKREQWNHHTKIVNISGRQAVIENIFLKPLA